MNTTSVHNEAANELYAMLSPALRTELAKHEKSMTVPEGTNLIRHGELLDHLVIINSGKVEVTLSCARKQASLGLAQGGKVFGMRAIVAGEPPEVDVICLESCDISILPRDAFLALLKSNPEIYFAVAKVLSSDLQIADRVLRASSRRCAPQPIRES
ncbi:MAG: cyclic nucleotide-binding domain-containing protein [Acidobacteriia bacterium]|nr:cyclic nucleotide-binding domain-containing protein [Terriglobia bacterium]